MSNVAARINSLTPKQLALLSQRLTKQVAGDARQHTIERRRAAASYPLSHAQQRLWFLDQLEPGGFLYIIPAAIRLQGALDVSLLERTLSEVVRRHEVLRTRFAVEEGRPVQVVETAQAMSLPLIDLSDLAGAEAQARRLAEEEARRPFDLARGPLLRVTVLRLAAEDHVMLFTMHHIVSDGWSMGVLTQEVTSLYRSFIAGKGSPLAELPIQYADYAVWQREWLTDEVLEEHLKYWKQKLGGYLPTLELPTDRQRPAIQAHRGETQTLKLSPELSDKLKELSREQGVTLFILLLAAFKTLLFHYSAQEDIIVGTPVGGRGRVETESLIGFFVNTLVLRTDLSGDPSFRELLGRVREVVLEAHQHQHVPFEKLVAELRVERSLSHAPLFQAMFMFENTLDQAPALPGLRLRQMGFDASASPRTDLELYLWETAGGLQGKIVYDRDLFDAVTIARFNDRFASLLLNITEQPGAALSDLALLSSDEQDQQLVTWNSTQSAYPSEKTIQQLFEEQAQRTPDKTAVVYEETQLTYRELNERANQLAHYLRASGVGAETLVGILMERSIEMLVGLLGILKAGGAYVALDAQYPAERLKFMLDDTKTHVLLTQHSLVGRLPTHEAELICLDTEWPAIAVQPQDNLLAASRPDNLAYISYTSGSTGWPKGVSIPQRAVVRLVRETNFVEFTADDCFLQLAPLGFDASTFEIWGSLLNGARLVLMPPQTPSLTELGEALKLHGVTTLWLTAGLFHLMVDEQPADLAGVRQLLAGGDVLSITHVQKLLRAATGCTLINGYGPTENTTFTCCYRMSSTTEFQHSVPIGSPVANTQAYVLGEQLQLLPAGVVGELYAGGDGLARGYLNQPQLTAEKFIPHPFSTKGGERLYRTGDLVRYRASGTIEFVGRRDQQVKVRGFRIELGEVEAALAQHDGVRECVVTVRALGESSNKQLIAYVVPQAAPPPTTTALLSYLKEKLPEYMMPSAFVMLDSLPLMPNGKLDRHALPEPDGTRPEMEASYVEPRNRIEEALAGVWADVLKLERVGVHDNFFELGGDSIISIQVIARVNQSGLRLTTRQLFLHQTIAELAAVVDDDRAGESEQTEIDKDATPFSLVRGEQQKLDELIAGDRQIEDIYPLSPMQQGMLFHSAYSPESGAYLAQTICTLPGNLNVSALRQACQQVIDRHEVLRTAFVWEHMREPLQVVRRGIAVPWQQEDWRGVSAAEQTERLRLFLRQDQERGFDLAVAPLLRFALFQTGDDSYRLTWTTHHLLLDGWSGPLVLREVFEFYGAFVEGNEGFAPVRPRPFRDYIAWLQRQDTSQAESFWRGKLAGFSGPTAFGIDVPLSDSANTEAAYEEARIALSPETSSAMQALAKQHKLTLNTLTQGAWALLLSRYSGNDDVVFGTTVSGRPAELPGVETMVGLFINTLPVRVRVRDKDSLMPWLENLQAEQAEMRQYDYSSLVQIQGWSEVPRAQPLFESNLVFFNLPEAAPAKKGEGGESTASREAKAGLVSRDLSAQSKTPTDIPLTLKSIPGTQMQLEVLYDNRRFDAAIIRRVLKQWRALIESMIAQPESNLETFKQMLNKIEAEEKTTAQSQRKESNLKRFMNAKPKAITMSRENLIETSYLHPGETLPLVVQPGVGDLDLSNWAKHNLPFIEKKLLEHGGILFRGFDVDSIAKFNQFTLSISPEQLEYIDQHTPRTRVTGKIYTSTEYPAEHYVPFHSENSKNHLWPMKIWFHCLQPAAQGGETPIADNGKVFDLLDPKIKERFMRQGVMYVRNFGEGLGVPWQTVFQTTERSEVEAYFRGAGVEFEWKDDARLRIRHVAQAVATHPLTGKTVWFNQAHLFHVSSLEPIARQSLLSLFTEEELPSNAYYGDGAPIEDSVIEEIRGVFRQSSVSFPWQAKDILMLDNMSIAHGRAPYQGPRKIVVAMAEAHGNGRV